MHILFIKLKDQDGITFTSNFIIEIKVSGQLTDQKDIKNKPKKDEPTKPKQNFTLTSELQELLLAFKESVDAKLN